MGESHDTSGQGTAMIVFMVLFGLRVNIAELSRLAR